MLLPPYDSRETLARLSEVVARYRPLRIIALGDSLHDPAAAGRIGSAEDAELRRLQAGRDWIWITGNHDPEIGAAFQGTVMDRITIADLVLRHEPSADVAPGEIAGHLHPAARVRLGGAGLRRPCFVGDGSRLVLPAFGAFAGGLNILDVAFAPLFPASSFEVHVLGRDGVYPVARASLAPD
jgi:DNA ligase-associated metallophosphoesterase